MVVSFKDALRLFGLTVTCFCAVFVCTFFLNFYLDAKSLEAQITDAQTQILYDAQMATAKITCAISGGFLGLIAVVMLIFYIKLYLDGHAKQIGVLKAIGYPNGKIALRFAVFGLSVLLGTALGYGAGYAAMPAVYSGLLIGGLPEIAICFHPALFVLLVFLPPAVYSVLSCAFAYIFLRRPVYEMLRGKTDNGVKKLKRGKENNYGFLKEACFKSVSSKKPLAFFVAFAGFCFAAMVQMAASMRDLSSEFMGGIIFAIGAVLAVTTLVMAVTSLVNANVKTVSVMKAFGYSLKECFLTILGGFHVFALAGFALGTVYQYGLLYLMVNIVYKDVGMVPDYSFGVPAFFITLAAFIVFYEAVMLLYTYKMSKISVKEAASED